MSNSIADKTDDDIRNLDWYYTVELRPGVFTKEQKRHNLNVLPTRALLSRIDVSNMDVLDIGTQEGYFSMLLDRAGARVSSYDRCDLSDRIKIVKDVYRVSFDYMCGEPFHRFADRLHGKGRTFDAIVFSGVLYHVIDPTLFLYNVRKLLRPGGIMLIESAMVVDDDSALLFNEKGRFLAKTNYYLPTTAWIDYYLRLLGFQILDLEHVRGQKYSRVAMTCNLIGTPLLENDDKWARQDLVRKELEEYGVPSGEARIDGAARVKVKPIAGKLHRRLGGVKSIHVTDAAKTLRAFVRDQAACVMKLEDRLENVQMKGSIQIGSPA